MAWLRERELQARGGQGVQLHQGCRIAGAGGDRRPLAFPCVTRVLGFVLLPCKALLFLAKVLLSGFCCSPRSALSCRWRGLLARTKIRVQ